VLCDVDVGWFLHDPVGNLRPVPFAFALLEEFLDEEAFIARLELDSSLTRWLISSARSS
jgi:hypothetical protein